MPHPDPNPKRDLYDHSHGRKVCRQGREMGAVGGEKKVSEPSLARYLHRNYPFFDVLSKNNVLTENLVHNKKLLNPDIQGNRIPFIFQKLRVAFLEWPVVCIPVRVSVISFSLDWSCDAHNPRAWPSGELIMHHEVPGLLEVVGSIYPRNLDFSK